MNFGKGDLRRLIEQGLITGIDNIEDHLTPNGVDLRLAALVEIVGGGHMAVDKKNHRGPKLGKAYVLKGYESRLKGYDISQITSVDPGTPVELKCHQPYFAMTLEEAHIPPEMMSHIEARTSLFRYAQTGMFKTVGEAGYDGFLTYMLVPFLDGGSVEMGARFCQLVFAELRGHDGGYDSQKTMTHQGGMLFKKPDQP
ncbi:hypothetical protein HY489_00710 [Candidatus Woesearchaeota archaeon]|nr:hypothetical protein [Candidatus Woesearchaeota archaeon]